MLTETRLAIADFLNIILFENKFIIINYWSIWHILFGGFVMFLIFKFFKDRNEKLKILFLVLVLWEIFEMVFWVSGSTLFRRDPYVDIIWDIILGFAGGFIVYKKMEKRIP